MECIFANVQYNESICDYMEQNALFEKHGSARGKRHGRSQNISKAPVEYGFCPAAPAERIFARYASAVHSPCLLQYSRAFTFAALVRNTASGFSPGARFFRSTCPSAKSSMAAIQ